jgi:hypothetical protein
MSQNISNVELLVDGKSPLTQMKEYTHRLVNRWGRLGLLEGMDNDYDRNATAILLENQARQILTEASRTGTSAGSEEWAGVALPLVRRIFAEVAAKDFVSVQPMNLPSGLVFYLDFKYGTSQPGFTVDTTLSQVGTIHGVTSAEGDPSGGLYGAGRFGYSINEASESKAAVNITFTNASWKDLDFNPDLSASVAALKMWQMDFGLTSGFDTLGVRSFTASGSIHAFYPQYSKYLATNSMSLFVSGANGASSGVTSSAYLVYYNLQPTSITRGDFEERAAGTLDIPELDLDLRSEPITAKTRKLKAVWTPEFAQDLAAYHSIDAEAEVTSILSEYISMEIDLEILDMLMTSATGGTKYWSALPGYEYDATSNVFSVDSSAVAGYAYQKNSWYQTLAIKMQRLSNDIHQKTMRGGANFVVCSPTVATVLESMPGFSVDTDGNKMQFAMGVQKVGLLNNRYTVYKNPYMLENVMLMGFRGTQFLETGAVYAPYVPLIMTPLIYDPTTFTPRKGIMTRYAKKVTRPEFYGKVVIAHYDKI